MTGLGAALLILAGCNGGDQNPSRGNAAQAASADSQPFANLPAGVPAYPGAASARSESVSAEYANGVSGRMVRFRTSDRPRQVVDFYADAATRAGYHIDERTNTEALSMIGYSKPGAPQIAITATAGDGATEVSIMFGTTGR